MLLYEGDTDIHVQIPPEEMSLTLNFIVLKPHVGQYVFDIDDSTVMHQIGGPENMIGKLVSVACSIGDETLVEMLKELVCKVESDNIRIYACTAMLRYGLLTSDEAKALLARKGRKLSAIERFDRLAPQVEFDV